MEPAVAKPKLPSHPSQMAERGIPASPRFEHPIALARLCLTNCGLPAPGWSLANAASSRPQMQEDLSRARGERMP